MTGAPPPRWGARRARIVARLAVVGGLLLAASPARSQTAPAPEVATVRGVVHDSLAGRPLAGARVGTADGLHATTADANGRFVLDGVPVAGGSLAVLAEHAAADSVGLATLAASVRLVAGGVAEVTVAIPSFRSSGRACSSASPTRCRPGPGAVRRSATSRRARRC